jgi:hypothetical protein
MTKYRPKWYYGNIVASPAAGTALVSFTVPKGYVGHVFGFSITTSDSSGNQFYINWTSNGVSMSFYIVVPGPGTVFYETDSPINEGSPADPGTTITITNVNAGSGNYFAGLKLLAALG